MLYSQLNAIIHGLSPHHRLVYDGKNLKSNSFIHLGSIKLVEDHFITHPAEIYEKVNAYILKNLDRINSEFPRFVERLRPSLQQRIQNVHSKLYSFIGFIPLLFSPHAKKDLLRQEEALVKLNETLSQLSALQTSKQDHHKTASIVPPEDTSDLEFKTSPSTPKGQGQRSVPPSYETPRSDNSLPLPMALGDESLSFSVPPPPPPPPSLLPTLDPIVSGEPKPLPFDEKPNFKLSIPTIQEQITQIDTYVAGMATAIEPLKQALEKFGRLSKEIKDKQEELNLLLAKKANYEQLLHGLEEAKAGDEPTTLLFNNVPYPFIPDPLYEKIMTRQKAIEDNRILRREILTKRKEQLEHGRSHSDSKESLSEATNPSTSQASESPKNKNEIESIENELKDLNSTPKFEIDRLPYFNISLAMSNIRRALQTEVPESRCQSLRSEIEASLKELKFIQSVVNNGIKFEQFPDVLERKTEQIKRLTRFKNARQRVVDGKKTPRAFKPKSQFSTPKTPPISTEFSFLNAYANLTQFNRILLNINGVTTSPFIENTSTVDKNFYEQELNLEFYKLLRVAAEDVHIDN